jgi:hypothetical protein
MVIASPREFGIEFELWRIAACIFKFDTDGKAGDRRIADAAFEVRAVCYHAEVGESLIWERNHWLG